MTTSPKTDRTIEDALALHRAGDLAAASGIYASLLQRHPNDSNALRLFGVLRFQQGRLDVAESLIAKAVKINGRSADSHYFLGRVLWEKKRTARAIAALEACLALDPRHEGALVTLGCFRLDGGQPADAIALFERAIAANPRSSDALFNLAKSLQRLGRSADALACFDRAIQINPRHAEAFYGSGVALAELRRFDEALARYCRAIELKPDLALAYYRRGGILAEQNRFPDAVADFARARKLDPTIDYNLGSLIYARRNICDWRDLDAEHAELVAELRQGKRVAVPFPLLAMAVGPEEQLACATRFIADRCPPSPDPLWRGERHSHDRIRVAYVSADFRDQPMPFLTVGMFEKHDRSRFETIAVSLNGDASGALRDRLHAAFARFIDVRDKSDHDIAALMRDMEVDIAVDLMGHTRLARTGIFALRPAPVQASYMGFPGTMGAPYIDYLLADRTVVPAADDRCYTEKIVALPNTYYVYDDTRPISSRFAARHEAALPETGFVFCSFNQAYKFSPVIFDVWMRLLAAIEGSVLWLLAPAHDAAQANLRREAQQRGIAPERIVFAPRIPLAQHADHLARHRLADLFLDTPFYNSHTTACDALWAGLPVLTCPGSTFAGRVAASLLGAIGLTELIAASLADYEELALKLAREPTSLAAVTAKLARNRTTWPLFDTALFTRHLEAAYTEMWRRRQRGEPPAAFAVENTFTGG